VKIFSVSVPVHAHVVVYVEAENEETAEEIACASAFLPDCEPIDFSNSGADIAEIDEKDLDESVRIFTGNNKLRRPVRSKNEKS